MILTNHAAFVDDIKYILKQQQVYMLNNYNDLFCLICNMSYNIYSRDESLNIFFSLLCAVIHNNNNNKVTLIITST